MSANSQAVSASAVRAAEDVRVAVTRLRRRMKETYDSQQITASQSSVLARLNRDGPASVGDLAAAERVRHQSMAASVKALEERGLVVRTPDPADGRRQLVSLSEQGEQFVLVRRRVSGEWLTRALQDLCTEEERRTVIAAMALLDRLARS